MSARSGHRRTSCGLFADCAAPTSSPTRGCCYSLRRRRTSRPRGQIALGSAPQTHPVLGNITPEALLPREEIRVERPSVGNDAVKVPVSLGCALVVGDRGRVRSGDHREASLFGERSGAAPGVGGGTGLRRLRGRVPGCRGVVAMGVLSAVFGVPRSWRPATGVLAGVLALSLGVMELPAAAASERRRLRPRHPRRRLRCRGCRRLGMIRVI